MGSNYKVKYIDRERNEEVEIPLEKMVEILLYMETSPDFHMEALKALAIVIRTKLVRSSKPVEGEGFKDILDSNYNSKYMEKFKGAVEATKSMVITFNGKLIDAKYHLVCGGSTENAENVINNRVIYLRRVLCNYCENSPYWKNEKSFTIDEIADLLKVKFSAMDLDFSSEISGYMENIERDEHGRVRSIKVGNKYFTGKELMELLDLNSTRFTLFPTEVKFVSRGKGHGLGLCQYGAEKMAQEGYSYEDIIKYYYTGVEIKKYRFPSIKEPLFGKILVIDPGHGGEDEGYKGDKLGLLEKDIVLKISLELKKQLTNLGAEVYMTRERDENILVTERIEVANRIRPDFFVSIHMDYFPSSNMQGCQIYHFRGDFEAQALATSILKELKAQGIASRGIKEGNFYLFRGVSVSSLLIEIGFLSNNEEEARFAQENYIIKYSDGITKGILEYFKI